MLETLCRFDSSEKLEIRWTTEEVIEKLIRMLPCLETESPDFLTEEIIETSLELILSATELHRCDLHPLIQLVKMLFRLPPMLTKAGALKTLCELRDRCGRNLLHVACIFGGKYYADLYATIRLLLLNAGCDTIAIDEDGNAPLHYLAQLDERKVIDLNMIAGLLLNFGAQLSQINVYGNQPLTYGSRRTYEKMSPK